MSGQNSVQGLSSENNGNQGTWEAVVLDTIGRVASGWRGENLHGRVWFKKKETAMLFYPPVA